VKNVTTAIRTSAALGVAGLVAVMASGPAMAAEKVTVSNSETIQAQLDAVGSLQEARIYEQIAVQGNGKVTISNPVSTENLRNLDGFGSFDIDGDNLRTTFSVDGQRRLRTVSDHTKPLPLKVTATYELDGEKVDPADVVGKSGTLKVHYKVENVTGKGQDVTFDDGTGKQVTRTEKVVIPMVGSLTTVLPSSFTDVKSNEANMAGDGRGGTKMSFTMTLFGPIGSPVSEFGYTAEITDGVIPAASISALPVSPLESPSFKGGAASYKGGAETGLQLATGAVQIDENVLKLRDGAAELVVGLMKLRDGAEDLKAGLAEKAAPGAGKLADGAGQLSAGTSKLNAGAGALKAGSSKLAAGAGDAKAGSSKLAAGAGDAKAGSAKLADGSEKVSEGLDQITKGVSGLPENLKTLKAGVAQIKAGIGSADQPATLLGGVAALQAGLPAASGGVKQVRDKLVAPDLAQLKGAAAYAKAKLCTADPALDGCPQLNAAGQGLTKLETDLGAAMAQAVGALNQIAAGLDGAVGNLPKMKGGLEALRGGTDGLSNGIDQLVDGITNSLMVGLNQANGGAAQVASGAGALDSGLGTLAGGAKQLDAGLGTLAGGAGQLDSGVGTLKDGTKELDNGAGQIASGSKELAAGLKDAADGSGLLADGLGQAADGAPALEDGAGRLSAEGTSKLVDAGKKTASDFGLKYALIEAGAERAKAEGMAYGAPADAAGATAYSFELAAVTDEGSSNLGRGLGALALFGVGAGVAAWRRRLI
jgi:putative membrane protein